MFKPSPKTEEPTSVTFPRINMNAIDRILKDSDDEEDVKKQRKESNNYISQVTHFLEMSFDF